MQTMEGSGQTQVRPNIEQAVGGRPPQYAPVTLTFDLLTDLESGVRVTCDVGYLCANFSLPMPLCSRLRPNTSIYLTTKGRLASNMLQ